ncbi:MAG TPA: DnaJ domain-containing protein [Sphingomicrobium sp.]|jgi:hypothetical protein|nr:DnaJ domain-containing protein [Sphingomicrobium sp.]
MAKQKRSDDWGFPRWRPYGAKGRDAVRVRLCDRAGCDKPGDRPAPKAPNSRERWYFCEGHAAEYNKNWNYFEGLDAEAAAEREREEQAGASAFRSSAHYQWGGPGDGSRSREEMRALTILGVEADADHKAVRSAYRRLAKQHHPDLKQGDKAAEQRFREIQAAYDVLKKAEERRAQDVRGTSEHDAAGR